MLSKLIKKLPFIRPLVDERDHLHNLVTAWKRHKESIQLLPNKLQDVDPEVFQSLEANDILFVDSTHVSRVNSDVNRILFEILPALKSGVYVHFHDVFYPFEYTPAAAYGYKDFE